MAFTKTGKSVEKAWNKMGDNFGKLADAVENSTQEAAVDEAFRIMDDARRMAPLDTGALKQSGFVSPMRKQGWRGADVTINFGFSAPYALIQHENLTYKHPKGGEAKYLHKAIMKRGVIFKSTISERLTRQMRATLDTRISSDRVPT